MKILIVVENFPPYIGGVETLFKKIADGLAEAGDIVYIITSSHPDAPSYEVNNNLYIRRIWTPSFGRRYWFTLLSIFGIFRYIKTVDAVQTTTYNAAIPAWIMAKCFRKKIVITIHEVWQDFWMKVPDMNWLSKIAHRLFELLLLKLSFDYYVTDSHFTEEALRKYLKKESRIKTVYCGIDYELFSREKYIANREKIRSSLGVSEKKVGLYYGRPGWAKGLEYFVRSIPKIANRLPAFMAILIVSEEPRKKYLQIKSIIKDLDITERVIILNPVERNDLPGYLLSADCIVVPSLAEGFGFTVAESSALEIPIVASRVGSIPEIISGKHVLVDPADVDQISQGVISLLTKSDEFSGKKKKFFWTNTIASYRHIYTVL